MENYNEIIEIFKFEESERKIFNYFIDDYCDRINNWLINNRFNKEQLIKYMIVGFILDFIATNNHQDEFNTFVQDELMFKEKQKENDDIFNNLYKDLNMEINNNCSIDDFIGNNYEIVESEDYLKIFKKRQAKNKKFNDIYGKPIRNSEEYIKLIHPIDLTNEITGEKLFYFVV